MFFCFFFSLVIVISKQINKDVRAVRLRLTTTKKSET